MLDDLATALYDVDAGATAVRPRPLMLHKRRQEEDGTPVLEGQPRLHPRPARARRLHDDRRPREPGHHRVALRERPSPRLLPWPELRDHSVLPTETLLKLDIRLGERVPQTRPDHRHRSTV